MLSGGILFLVMHIAHAPLSRCSEQKHAVEELIRDVLIGCQIPAVTKNDVGPFAEESLASWTGGAGVWHSRPAIRLGRGCAPSFALAVNGCDWLLVARFRESGSFADVRAYASKDSGEGLPHRVAKVLRLPVATPSDPRDGVATALSTRKFVVFEGIHPSQRASFVTTACSDARAALCGMTVKAVGSRVSPIARLDLDSDFASAWKITFGRHPQTGFLVQDAQEDEPRIEGRCLHASGLTLSLDTGVWTPQTLPDCDAIASTDAGR